MKIKKYQKTNMSITTVMAHLQHSEAGAIRYYEAICNVSDLR